MKSAERQIPPAMEVHGRECTCVQSVLPVPCKWKVHVATNAVRIVEESNQGVVIPYARYMPLVILTAFLTYSVVRLTKERTLFIPVISATSLHVQSDAWNVKSMLVIVIPANAFATMRICVEIATVHIIAQGHVWCVNAHDARRR